MRKINMALSAPSMPEISRMESLASSEEPSLEGSWWITFQTVEHVLGSISATDRVNHRYLPAQLSELLEHYVRILTEQAVRPIPNDRLQQLVRYLRPAVAYVLHKPRSNLVKEEARIRPHELREMRTKTMNWLTRQPGGSLKEKLAGNKRMSALVNEFSFDTKENRVAVSVLDRLSRKIRDRIENGINHELAYDCNRSDVERYDELEEFLQLHRRKIVSPLREVQPKDEHQPNNVLLNDKHYSIIWRTNQMLKAYERHISENWKLAFDRYVQMLFWAVAASVVKTTAAAIFDGIAVVFDNGNVVGLQPALEAGEEASSIRSIRLLAGLNGRGQLSLITISLDEKLEITVNIQRLDRNGATYAKLTESEIKYRFSLVNERVSEPRRGVSLHQYRVSKDGEELQTSYADSGGLRELSAGIASDVASNIGLELQLPDSFTPQRNNDEIRKTVEKGLAFDFTTRVPRLRTAKMPVELLDKDAYAVVLRGTSGERATTSLVLPKRGSLYDLNYEAVSLGGMVSGEDGSPYGTGAFSGVLERIREDIGMPTEGYLVYTIPDSVDEFSQRSMKSYLHAATRRSYPVWRSIAGAMAWSRESVERIEENWNIVVIDTHEAGSNAVLLRTTYNDKIEGIVFEHYAPFAISDEDFEINANYLERTYLKQFVAKYRLQLTEEQCNHLIRSGQVYRVLSNRESVTAYSDSAERLLMFSLTFDEEIYERVLNGWRRNFNEYTKALTRNGLPRGTHAILVISDHVSADERWMRKLKEFTKCELIRVLTTDNVAEGALIVHDRLLLKQPTWYEYLPNLSLEVVKDGRYDELVLIKNETINVMGEDKLIHVPEDLTLEAGHTHYRFPLVKGNAGRHNIDFNAMIRHESFPLQTSLHVNLAIRYRYGDENTYELIVTPIEREGAPFDSIVAEWVEQDYIRKENEIPAFPYAQITEESVQRSIEQVWSAFGKVERFFEYKVLKSVGTDDGSLGYMEEQLFRSIRHIQAIVRSRRPEAKDFVERFYRTNLVLYLGELIGIGKGRIPETLYSAVSRQALDKFINTAAQMLCSFGTHGSPTLFRHVIRSPILPDKHRLYGRLLWANAHQADLLDAIIQEFRNEPESMIRALRDSVWEDETVIKTMYERRPEFFTQFVKIIMSEFRRNYANRSVRKYLANLYRDYCEVLLAILRLREIEGFPLLHTGSEYALRLAKYIRRIDAMLYEGRLFFRTKVRFSLEKPQALRNMSDIGFALNGYLTGDMDSNLIQVSGIEHDIE